MTDEKRLLSVRTAIANAERKYHRPAGSVRLLGVSKQQPAIAIRALALKGLADVGENYVQEALSKQDILDDIHLRWHFIGRVQSNKTREIASRFAWVHSVDRLKIAQRLAAQRPPDMPPLNICLQVNAQNEASKAGLTTAELADVAHAVSQLTSLRFRGLMAIPQASDDFERQRANFRTIRELQLHLIERGLNLDTLSMGMTTDMEAAIAEGATIVRIGTALFGPRTTRPDQQQPNKIK